MEWYYVKDGASCGPISRSDLERMAGAGDLNPGDLVWNSSMGEEWARADSIEGLFRGRESVHALQRSDPSGVIGLVGPAKTAWQRMVTILFRPFDIGKWFAMGFAAWLATMGEHGGTLNPGSATGSWTGEHEEVSVEGMLNAWREAWAPVQAYLDTYGGIVIAGLVVIAVLGLAFGIVLLWLRSRGRFMLLDNVLRDTGDIAEAWHAWSQHANALFRWSLGYGVICFLIGLGILALAWPLVIKPCVEARVFVPSALGGAVVVVVLLMLFSVVTFYISRFLNDFIVPIMYRHDLTASEAWGRFLEVYRGNVGRFLLYGLYMLWQQFIAGLAILAAVVATCFIAGCLMGLPYIGAVILLPVSVFFRLYGVEYLAQYGGEFVVEGRDQ